jgi:TPR repeat protein
VKTRYGFVLAVALFMIGVVAVHAQMSTVDPRAEQLWQQALQLPGYQQFPLLLEAAKLGHPRAEGAIGSAYMTGSSQVQRNYQLALYWLDKSASQGNRGAQFNLAGMYTMGLGGLTVDPPRAADLLTASARQGYAPAQEALGTCYEFAEGVTRNRQTAIYWLDQAAAQGRGTAARISRALKDPRTPQFASEAQLANYMTAPQGGTTGSGSGQGVFCMTTGKWTHGVCPTPQAAATLGTLNPLYHQ